MKVNHLCIFFALTYCSLTAQTVSKPFLDKSSVAAVDIFFETGSYELDEEAKQAIASIQQFKELAGLNVFITAHTDSIGSVESNLQLSQNRADKVKEELLKVGLDIDSLLVNYFGEAIPRSNNNNESGRQDNRRCTIELYKNRRLVWVDGIVKDSVHQPLEAEVIIRTRETENKTKTDSAGHYRLRVPFNQVASLEIYPKDYFFDVQMFKTTPGEKRLKFDFQPLEVDRKIRLNNFYFVGNQAVLLKKSEPELPRLLRVMQNQPNLKIKIIGHVNVPNAVRTIRSDSHHILSVNRAKMVYTYLTENGVDIERMEYEGRGNWEMKFPFAITELQQELNRRVEIQVLEKENN